VKVRAKISKIDKRTLAITEIPYTTTTESIKDSIIKANDKGKIKIRKVDDNTADKVEIVIQVSPDESSDKTIDALYRASQAGVKIDIEDDGRVVIYHMDRKAIDKAVAMVEEIVREAKVGEVYEGKVVRIESFGCFVNLFGNVDGMCHVSQLAWERVNHPKDVVKIGQTLKVRVTEIDEKGRVNLSHKEFCPKPVKKADEGKENKESKENKVETKVFSVDEEEKKESKKVEVKEVKKEAKEEKVDYSTMTVSELKKLAKEQGVSGYSTMKKDELISSLK